MASMWKEFSKGLWTEIPPFRVVLGLCPTLAVTRSAENGLGMGLGFTLSLTVIGSIREVLGNGTLFSLPVMWEGFSPFKIMIEAPGAFLALGSVLALMNCYTNYMAKRAGKPLPEGSACQTCGGCALGQ